MTRQKDRAHSQRPGQEIVDESASPAKKANRASVAATVGRRPNASTVASSMMMRASCPLKKAPRHPHGRFARAAGWSQRRADGGRADTLMMTWTLSRARVARSRRAVLSAAPAVLPSHVLGRVAAVSSARAGMHGADAADRGTFAVNCTAIEYLV